MVIEPPGSSAFVTDFSSYELVGFHATALRTASTIEAIGLIPHKVLDDGMHDQLLAAAHELSLPAGCRQSYAEWLQLRSVSFARNASSAIAHVCQGMAIGQGMVHVNAIVEAAKGVAKFDQLVTKVQADLEPLRASPSVVYAVDLSGLGDLVTEELGGRGPVLRVRWRASDSLTSTVLTPDRLIARIQPTLDGSEDG